jgi:hypothetical protein
MDPEVWGPKLWFVIHTFALNYPNNPSYEDKRVMEEFFNNLKYSIPCNKCRVHYRQRLERDPIINYLDNKQSLFKYTIDLHNQVNKSLGKKIYTYDEVVQIYKEHYNPDEVKSEQRRSWINKWFNPKYIGGGAIILVFLLVLVFYLRKKYPKRLIRI